MAAIVNNVDSVRFFRKARRILQEEPPIQSKADLPQPTPSSDPDPVHSVALAIALRDMAQRLASVEEKFEADRRAKPPKGTSLIEFSKVIFGGWPVLGFVFLFLFYAPLRDALNAIPEKVKTASEIGALGVSLKSTFQVEAAKLGATNLSETLPTLSAGAIELLLRAPRGAERLVNLRYDGYLGEGRQSWLIDLPSAWKLDAISELAAQRLIVLESSSQTLTGNEARLLIEEFLKKNPGRESPSTDYQRMIWKPTISFQDTRGTPNIEWQLTDLGKKALEVILKAVSIELAPKTSPKPNR